MRAFIGSDANGVIARQKREARLSDQDRAIQHAVPIVFLTKARVYWMPACAGMTTE
jgi:hypothetical protein